MFSVLCLLECFMIDNNATFVKHLCTPRHVESDWSGSFV